jgi:AcrR family transcriptional regulator
MSAAITCLVEDGYAATTTTRVAERAGLTRGALQFHFRDRADLMASVAIEGWNQLVSDLSAGPAAGPSLAQRIDDYLDVMVTAYSAPTAQAAYEVLYGARTDEHIRELQQPAFDQAERALDGLWRELLDSPRPTNATRAARHLARATILGLVLRTRVGVSTDDTPTIDALKASLAHLLSPSAPR